MKKRKMVWDMETSDPDDFLTLLLLCGHPRVDLLAVTVTPGSRHQIGLVRRALEWFALDIPVGAFDINHAKQCVSEWHYKAYGEIPPSEDAVVGGELLREICSEEVILVTGAALKNLGVAMEGEFRVGRLVVQGGFAGANLVPEESQLPKFKGKITCPTFNLNGDWKSALKVLSYPGIGKRRFVSKNVCHRVLYDRELHDRVGEVKDKSLSLTLIHKGMEKYLQKRPQGKLFHDPLAACCAINPDIGKWEEVELYRERGEWGAKKRSHSGTWIIVDYVHELFIETLLKTN